MRLQRGRALVSAEIGSFQIARRPQKALQRGRALVSAEIPACGGEGLPCQRASTGPRFGKRGDTPPANGPAGAPRCFNGAALW